MNDQTPKPPSPRGKPRTPPPRKKWPKRGVIGVISRQDRFLVIRRSEFVTAPLKVCLPGGTIEDGEAESETLVREMQEELDISVRPVKCCYRSETPWGTKLAWWVGDLAADITPVPNPDEVHEYFWMTIEEIDAVRDALPSLRDFFRAVRTGRINLADDSETDWSSPAGPADQ